MWEAISEILTAGNALYTLCAVIIIILLLIIMIKTGMIRIKTANVHVGLSDTARERTIIREQCDWVRSYLYGLEGRIASEGIYLIFDGYMLKYAIEKMYAEIVKWITFNNIEYSERYIKVKQDKLLNVVHSIAKQDYFFEDKFIEDMRKCTQEIIKQLIEIRKLYS